MRANKTSQMPFLPPGLLQRSAERAMRTTNAVDLLKGQDNAYLSRHLTWKLLSSRPAIRLVIMLCAAFGAMLGLAAPWYQKVFVDILTESGATHLQSSDSWLPLLTVTDPLIQAIIFAFLAMLLSQSFSLAVRLLCSREAALLHAALAEILYNHTLRLTSEARGSRTVGEIVNLYAQDVSAAVSLLEDFFGSALGALIPLAAAPFFVSAMIGMPLSAVMMVSLGCMVILISMSWRQSWFFNVFKRLAGERLAIVNEWLQNIRIIRILDWTEAFEARIFKKREEETENRIGMVTNGSTMNSIAQVAPLVINAVGVLILVDYKQGAATAGDIFALMWVFGVFMARPIRNTPWTLVMFLDGMTSCRRLERFFASPVEDRDSAFELPKGDEHSDTANPGLSLNVQGLSLSFSGRSILSNVSFQIDAGKFIAITGDVGAGKTQLLLSLLKDNAAHFESLRIGGEEMVSTNRDSVRQNFVYVPQDGFIMSATLRENIVFEYGASPSLDADVRRSLQISDFDPSHENLAFGLDTEIGERGVNLSGGQRQRVGMARAHYYGQEGKGRGIVLLDDCLSAVDVDTEEKLITHLINGAWKHKTRILVTHRLSVLKYADEVWALERGTIRKEQSHG